jgi:prephenate dehydrogenase
LTQLKNIQESIDEVSKAISDENYENIFNLIEKAKILREKIKHYYEK